MRNLMRYLFFCLLVCAAFVSEAADKKQLNAVRVTTAPKIDGVLSEEEWKLAEPAVDFIQRSPKPGESSKCRSEVHILYDDVAIYVGAMLYDSSPDSILHELSQRDNEANADAFGVFMDTYNDDINAYGFFVTAAGVQLDARYSSQGQDLNWNAVWQSQVKINDKGWCVEFKIPYSALRFPNVPEQKFGLNIIRKVRRTREEAFWNELRPEVDGLVNQCGDLNGISDIKSPLRLSLTPYVSAYLENYPYNLPGKSNNTYSLNGGMDIKYGINESFTLDMTLVPDFGQVQSDNQVLNLSPFEVRYDENRQFFTEGTELFNKGGLFYSRRVGGVPLDYYQPYYELKEGEYVKENPANTQLINATKISGRTRSNLGVGVFNATSANTYAVISDSSGNTRKVLTQPLTNYSVLVLDQALKNNSYISLINTNVTRDGHAYDANVTGTEFKFANRANRFALNGNAALSQLYFADSAQPVLGYMYALRAGKISGNLTYSIAANVKSDTYDPNDLGISFMNNTIETGVNVGYNIYRPFWKLNEFTVSGGAGYSWLYQPTLLWNFSVFGEAYTTFSRSFLSTGTGFNFEPIITYDHWEPRVKGRYYAYPKDYLGYYWFSSDYRKRFALDGRVNYKYFEENNRYMFSFGLDPRFRVNNKLSFVYSYNRSYQNDDIGFVNYNPFSDIITFGRRNVLTITNQLNINYIFTNKMSLSLRGRHYWSKAEYSEYYTLTEKGLLVSDSSYGGNSNVNFNAFNIDLVYKWQFSPGSEMSFVWKNAVYTVGDQVIEHFSDDVDETFRSPQSNSFSIKFLYYLDYSMLKRRNKKVP